MKPLLEQLLTDVVQQLRSAGEIPDTPGPDIQIQVMTTTAHGDYATNLALVLAPVIGVSPQVMAGRIVEGLPPISQLSQIDISDRGYINFYLDTALLHKVVGSILSAGSDYGRCVPEHRKRTVLRLIESRPASPFSLEQSRAVAIAGSLANLLEFTGSDLVREYYVHGGLPACRDSEIRRDMNEMGIYFDTYVSETSRQCQHGQNVDHLLLVVTADDAESTARWRALTATQGDTAIQPEILTVNPASWVRGRGVEGKPVPPVSRVTLPSTMRALFDALGSDSARYCLLLRERHDRQVVNFDQTYVFGRDNPLYSVQYAHARICSVLRTASEQGWIPAEAQGHANLGLLSEPDETSLCRILGLFPEMLLHAAETREPCRLTGYLQALANGLNRYYEAHRWLSESLPLRNARLCLLVAARHVLSNGLNLIDVSAPEVL